MITKPLFVGTQIGIHSAEVEVKFAGHEQVSLWEVSALWHHSRNRSGFGWHLLARQEVIPA
jgi:hypothetical protein